ncbi:hypothetical protein [Nocardia sp. NPDC005998]|uniref:hypothetical protein n=1 Tax=Nocardia sp. NPDC005998 TaxID=3156894 RepID=UPI0033A38016
MRSRAQIDPPYDGIGSRPDDDQFQTSAPWIVGDLRGGAELAQFAVRLREGLEDTEQTKVEYCVEDCEPIVADSVEIEVRHDPSIPVGAMRDGGVLLHRHTLVTTAKSAGTDPGQAVRGSTTRLLGASVDPAVPVESCCGTTLLASEA